MLKLKLQYFGHLMWRNNSLEKTLMLGKTEGRRRRERGWDGQMASPTQWTWVWVSSGSWWWIGRPGVLQSMGSWSAGHDCVTQLNWACDLFWGKFHEHLNMYSAGFGRNVLYMSVKSFQPNKSLKDAVFLLILCLIDLFINVSAVLKSPIIIWSP